MLNLLVITSDCVKGNEKKQCLALAQTIRAGFLTQKQKNEIIICLSISTKAGKRFSKIFENVLNSSRSQRCCVIEAHLKAGYKRCEIPAWNEELRPNENVKIKVSRKIQEEKDITFIDKSRPPPCVHKDDDGKFSFFGLLMSVFFF
uniref:Uncharacterized protein n=1 Tax=Panagrolaimus sp. PS1159 TaxID=55785 RepID=A0AC35GSG7_9BILA